MSWPSCWVIEGFVTLRRAADAVAMPRQGPSMLILPPLVAMIGGGVVGLEVVEDVFVLGMVWGNSVGFCE